MKSKEENGALAPTGEPLLLLVVDDEPAHAEVVAASLERIGAESVVVNSEKEAVATVRRRPFDVVVVDLALETNDGGLNVLKTVKRESPETEVVIMTAFNGVETAVEAMLEGAFNYLQKPLDLKRLRSIVRKAGEAARLRRVNRRLQERLDEKFGFGGVVGGSPEMLRVLERLQRIAPTDATVLILGETGTGKELFAQALHQNSPRKRKPFVALNCAAISENLLESELFGHIQGAFTDATSDRVGKFEYANGGTIFLDEVGDMPLATQIKLLRVLENGEITPVGSNKTIKVNVRLVSATNRNLEEAVENGSFRRDLYHRLKVVTLRIPSLRERRDDVPILLDHFAKIFCQKYGKKLDGVSEAARRRLFSYDWPGNVRQLRNVAESMTIFDVDGTIDVDDLPDEILDAFPKSNEIAGPTPFDTRLLRFDDGSNAAAPNALATRSLFPALPNPAASPFSPSEPNVLDVDVSIPETEISERRTAFPGERRERELETVATTAPFEPSVDAPLKSLVGISLDELERLFILETLRVNGGNREETAKILGVGERTLYRRLKEFAQNGTDAEEKSKKPKKSDAATPSERSESR